MRDYIEGETRVRVRARLDEARQDLRYAARTLGRSRAFATAATPPWRCA